MNTPWTTPDLSDQFGDKAKVLSPGFSHFGGKSVFSGEVTTVRCFEDNSKVKELAAQPGAGRVMVVDGAASLRRALLGDQIAANAVTNGWAGFIINGCVRDVEVLQTLDLGVCALAACPVKTEKLGLGEVDVDIAFGGVAIKPGQWVYVDLNGILLLDKSIQSIK